MNRNSIIVLAGLIFATMILNLAGAAILLQSLSTALAIYMAISEKQKSIEINASLGLAVKTRALILTLKLGRGFEFSCEMHMPKIHVNAFKRRFRRLFFIGNPNFHIPFLVMNS